ncbi:CLAVATA3/ESR (CLE)-related protein 46 isoform X1 [Arabidopsis lyrata subsp. lyrata]|uniref:CLAVATA3/ESR (CLE)-related protein 46 isoform X1 n=1 Tax=Arabidopsis lyrata subsp. lyrata TaxID=81972 RepID=UPI000A29C5C2|nr:CLAVATA3/ESR (CLE)-related protein 46 isoform X1 [Arabidopsis lyrata subsp. lyrata]|eukprot:XP_020886768.1 CLAVATA3/ESR (CLE)-related protein 46 isoform X1 [Arabidopsis lyrata subsp. lyrata]
MRRHDIIIKLLLLICFFLSRNMTRECREVHFKIGPAKIIAKPNYERVMPTWVRIGDQILHIPITKQREHNNNIFLMGLGRRKKVA